MKQFKDKLRVLIAAGGTGGHLLPGMEVAKKLEALNGIPNGRLRIEFVGVGRSIEKTILENEGFVSHAIDGLGLRGKGLRGLTEFLKIAPSSFLQAKALINSFRPDIVIGFGGYPSVLPVLVASLLGIPTWIHEADSSCGWATKFLALFVNKISSGFSELSLPFGRKAFFTGHPIRAAIEKALIVPEGFIPKNILVLGGSQASKALDLSIPKAVQSLSRTDLKIRHQARAENCEAVFDSYKNCGVSADVLPFIKDMPLALAESDLIISRSGAGAVTELTILNKPVIFVPLPKVSGPQLHNARTLERSGKSLIVEEGENFELRLEDALRHLLDPSVYRAMMLKPFPNSKNAAAQTIAEGVLELFLENKTLK